MPDLDNLNDLFMQIRPAGERQDLALMHLLGFEIGRIAERLAPEGGAALARPLSEAQLRQALRVHLQEMRVLAPLLERVIDAGQDDRASEDYEPPA